MINRHGKMIKPSSTQASGWHSRGYLPHFDSPETVQHLVFRAFDSLPEAVLSSLPLEVNERRKLTDQKLDEGYGLQPFSKESSAGIVEAALLHFDSIRYHLLAWCIMPNHVHVAVEQKPGFPVPGLVHSWKSFSAHQINANEERSGPVWAADYFDRFMRSESQLKQTVYYIEQNPVKAALVGRAANWRFSSAWKWRHA